MQKLKSVVSSSANTKPLPFRPARVIKLIRRIVTALIIFVVAIAGLTSLDNALTPAVGLSHAATGPAALSVVRAIEIDAKTGDLYAGSNGGVFRSTDGGVTWAPASHGLPGIDVQSLLYDKDNDVMYTVLFGAGLYRSSDRGQTWAPLGKGLRGDKLLTVAKDSRIPVMYAGMLGYGMYTSLDQGATWQTIGPGVSNTYIHQFLVGDQPGEVFVASDSGLWHSFDVTTTWELLSSKSKAISVLSLLKDAKSGVIYAGTDHGLLKIDKQSGNYLVSLSGLADTSVQSLQQDQTTGILYAGTLNGVMTSSDGAATWQPASNGLRSTLVRALLIKPGGAGLIAGTDSGIFLSSDGGANWQTAAQSPNARHVQAVTINPQDGSLYVGMLGGGVFQSKDNGATWTPINTGLSNTVVQSFGIDHGLNALYAGTRNGLYRTSLGAINWTLATPKSAGQDIQTIAVDDRHGNAYAITANGDVLRSSSDGATWAIVQPLQTVFPRSVAVSSFSSAVYVGAYKGGVQVSRDFGFTWRNAGGNMPDKNIETLGIDERDGTVYAGTLTGGVYSTKPDGGGWQKVGNSLPGNIVALAVDEKNGAVFAAVKAGLYRIGQNDQAWKPAMDGMAHTDILSAVYDRVTGALYAGTMAGGAYRSTDSGAKWTPVSNGLTDVEMQEVVADDASGTLSVAATDRGVYQTDDGGKTWRAANVGLGELTVRGLASNTSTGGASSDLNLRSDNMKVIPLDATYNSTTAIIEARQYSAAAAGGYGWQPQPAGIGNLFDLFIPINAYGFVSRLPSGDLVWALHGGGEIMARTVAGARIINAAIRALPDGRGWSAIYATWGAELLQSEPIAGYSRVPLAWMAARAWSYQGLRALNTLAPWWWLVVVGVAVLLVLLFMLGRLRLNRSFGVPLRVALLRPSQSIGVARKAALDANWPKWERTVQRQLFGYGDVTPDDVPSIPGPFRMYALQRYAQTYAKGHSVQLNGKRLHAAARTQMRRWASAWEATRAAMQREGALWTNRKYVDQLASSFAITLDLELLPGQDIDAVRAYATRSVDATGLPKPVAFLFIADNEALKRSVQNLSDALDKLTVGGAPGAPGVVGLVVSLGRPGRDVDVSAQIALAIGEADMAGRMIVLTGNGISAIMAANDPVQALAARLK